MNVTCPKRVRRQETTATGDDSVIKFEVSQSIVLDSGSGPGYERHGREHWWLVGLLRDPVLISLGRVIPIYLLGRRGMAISALQAMDPVAVKFCQCDRILQAISTTLKHWIKKKRSALPLTDLEARNGSRTVMPVRSPSLSMLISNRPNLVSLFGKY